ncbi:MAG: tetratricopeptide repeat protein [Candidatus Aminicenantes bacterium]|nr:MAG: tetratricopeptide repeat protein [Candidatus Aminicenantes bacterium]
MISNNTTDVNLINGKNTLKEQDMGLGGNYRYPGSRPFYDTDIDRRLFFGREREKELLLHTVLVDNLVVMYAKSGLGKTSLINAGLNPILRRESFFPVKVRFNDPKLPPVNAIYEGIQQKVNEMTLDYNAGEDGSLWQFFKTAEFWSPGNKMLKPVLILDQFEEFFSVHSKENRKAFTRQLADLVNNTVPDELFKLSPENKPFLYSEKPPNIRVIISIREDFLGELEEMSSEIPDILRHRFRLLPLSREQAREAIVKPMLVQDEVIRSTPFKFRPGVVDEMLNFLCKRMEKRKRKITDEVEPFQLQLLCRHLEEKVKERLTKETGDNEVTEGDLGGEKGMELVLQRFYDDLIKQLLPGFKRKRSRKLCERGLISVTGQRLSLEQEEIGRQFKVTEDLLQELVENRLLRSEARVGSIYYELSHDTLVEPIRKSYKKRSSKRKRIGFGVLFTAVILIAIFLMGISNLMDGRIKINKLYEEAGGLKAEQKYDEAAEKYNDILRIDKTYMNAYLELGQIYYNKNEYVKAIEIYTKAIANGIRHASIYYRRAQAFQANKQAEEAIKDYNEALRLGPKLYMAHEEVGYIYESRKNYEKAIENYKNALALNKKRPDLFKYLALAYIEVGEPGKAIDVFQQALNVNAAYVDIYMELADALEERGEQKLEERIYELASKSGSRKTSLYFNLGNRYGELEMHEKAIENYRKSLEINPDYAIAYGNMGNELCKLGKYGDAVVVYKKAIEIEPDYAYVYYNMGLALEKLKRFKDALAAYKKAVEIKPDDAYAYYNIGYVHYILNEYNRAIEAYKKAIEILPGHFDAKTNLAKLYLITGRFEDALIEADNVLAEKNVSIEHISTMRVVSISSLLLLGNRPEALKQLSMSIKSYKLLIDDFKRTWDLDPIKKFLAQNKNLAHQQRQLLLHLINILESPLAEVRRKLNDMEEYLIWISEGKIPKAKQEK